MRRAGGAAAPGMFCGTWTKLMGAGRVMVTTSISLLNIPLAVFLTSAQRIFQQGEGLQGEFWQGVILYQCSALL